MIKKIFRVIFGFLFLLGVCIILSLISFLEWLFGSLKISETS